MDPIEILEEEHKIILENLHELGAISKKAEKAKGYTEIEKDMENLEHNIHVLEEAEAHHKREEDVLFPMLEKKGVQGPPEVMRMEHIELRKRKKALARLMNDRKKLKFGKFQEVLKENADYLTTNLEQHINKENVILYPMAREAITQEEWKKARKAFDKIGYCSFSPVR